ncbi:NAD(P)-binding protein [Viridothelium virens]|uniref:NAD(P)-binding protein n=1 Tax=Viridothelium virens TaxID=1048519 RepID=A0A6A6HLN4_VIRVR|nr:NAD(P)-binding protein [Viridothelium virens]
MSTSAVRRILITGATGKQGGAVLRSLLSHPNPSPPLEIYALTRNARSPSALALTRDPRVSLIEGDLKDSPAIFRKLPHPAWGALLVTLPFPSVASEMRTGTGFASAAAANGVRHLVFASVERGINGDTKPTVVPHFASKFAIERHVEQVAGESQQGMTWTFLRPVAFMENMVPGFFDKAFAAMWVGNGWERRLQLVSVKDVGVVGAKALLRPEEFAGRSLSLAGDEVSPREANEIFREVVGREMPRTYGWVGNALKWVLREQLGIMFDWFKEAGFAADPKKMREEFPETQDLRTWLNENKSLKF